MTVLCSTGLWEDLLRHRETLASRPLSDLLLSDPERLDHCDIGFDGFHLNYALQHVTAETLTLLVALAREKKLEDWRARMMRGEKINTTEQRAVLHMALRQKSSVPLLVDGHDVRLEIKEARHKMSAFVNRVREGHWKGATGKSIKHIVNIGIGGSDLGPRLAVRALEPFASGPRVHFVANADAFDLFSVIKDLDPAETLFLVVSKTFTTQETLLNAESARAWLTRSLGEKAVAQHFVAVSTNASAVEKFGIGLETMFSMWDWVGGRFSLWSSVGLSVALALGMDHFTAMCDGAASMDEHFLTAPLLENMPVIMALLGVWQRDFCDARAQAILPYSERLRDLPRYLQQLEMESNGKTVTRDGSAASVATSPILFGESGTVGQHSFHQWLHQGSDKVPADFIGIRSDDLGHPAHHQALLSNMVAQAGALAFGQAPSAQPQDTYPGNRSSTLLLLDTLDPHHFGMLLALYEHKVFVQGVIWNINSFDQPGVELGKRMAKDLASSKVPQHAGDRFLARLFEKINLSAPK